MEIGSNDGVFLKNFNKKNIIAVEPCKNLAKITNKKGYLTYDKFWDVNLAKQILKKKGTLWMVHNKELIYENSINDLFPNYKYIDITKNYKIIKAIKCY